MAYLYIILGAIVGAPLRYYVQGRLQDTTGLLFPIGTLVVNLSGCFLIGLVAGLAEERAAIDRNARLALITGFLGSYTTFSSFAYESVQEFQAGDSIQAGANIVASVLGGLAAAWAGSAIARSV